MNKKLIFTLLTASLLSLGYSAPSFSQFTKGPDDIKGSCLSLTNDTQCYSIISTLSGEKDYAAYSRMVRERIKQKLESHYRHYRENGDVSLFFIIRPDGNLSRTDIDLQNSTSDKKLLDIAIASLEASSPFPPIPERLSGEELPFSVTISFQEKR